MLIKKSKECIINSNQIDKRQNREKHSKCHLAQ